MLYARTHRAMTVLRICATARRECIMTRNQSRRDNTILVRPHSLQD